MVGPVELGIIQALETWAMMARLLVLLRAMVEEAEALELAVRVISRVFHLILTVVVADRAGLVALVESQLLYVQRL
jgi:hypothetical protein